MRRNFTNRIIEHRVVDDHLERQVTLPNGRSYMHRCSKKVFQDVAYYLLEHPTRALTMSSVASAIDAPFTQVNVALELLKERGILETRRRLSYVGECYRDVVYEHAMVEFLALEAGQPPRVVVSGQ